MKKILMVLSFLTICLQSTPTFATLSSPTIASAKQYCKTYISSTNWSAGGVDAASVSSHYALCMASDEYVGDMLLFKFQNGTYQIIASGKPTFDGAPDLEDRGNVPASEAQTLWAGLKAQVPSLSY